MSLVGIAILPGNIHIVQLQKRKNAYALVRACRASLPADIFSQGKVVAFDGLTKYLREIVQTERLAGLQAAACMPMDLALLQRMRMPAGIEHSAVEAEIAAEVQKHAHSRREKMVMDFQIQSPEASGQLDVIFAVTPEAYITNYQASFAQAGLKLAVMDLDIFALQRGMSPAIDQPAMLYITANTACFAVLRSNDNPIYRYWDPQQTSFDAWLLICAELCQQLTITSMVVGLDETKISIENVVASLPVPDIRQLDPFKDIPQQIDNPSVYWLAYGLALRSALPWLN